MYATLEQFLSMLPDDQCRVTHLDLSLIIRENKMNKYETKWLVNFARSVRRGDIHSHFDIIDALPSSLLGCIVWC